jgi:hypothetical protein
MPSRWLLRLALIATTLLLGGWFVGEWVEANETRTKSEKTARNRDKIYEALFERIEYGSTPWGIEERIGWPGTHATGTGWPRTVRDVPDLEPIFIERERERIMAGLSSEQRRFPNLNVPTDVPLDWIVWKVEGRVKYIAAGCVKQNNGLVVVARMYGLADAAEPAVPVGSTPR